LFVVLVRNKKNKHNRMAPDAVIPVETLPEVEETMATLHTLDRKGHFVFTKFRVTDLQDVINYVESNQK